MKLIHLYDTSNAFYILLFSPVLLLLISGTELRNKLLKWTIMKI